MKGGRASRDKGNRLERAVVHLLQDHGLGAERIPLSGSAGGSFSGDVTTPLIGRDVTIECKSRANGFLKLCAAEASRRGVWPEARRRRA